MEGITSEGGVRLGRLTALREYIEQLLGFLVCGLYAFFDKYLSLSAALTKTGLRPLLQHMLERETGLEPATPTLARSCSTN